MESPLLYSHIPSEEICDEDRAGSLLMCPLCDTDCDLQPLKTSCNYARLTHMFDNDATVFFAFFMAIWASVFLKLWKRKETKLQYNWGVSAFKQEERLRPEFKALAVDKNMKEHPVTKVGEREINFFVKTIYFEFFNLFIIFLICLVIAAAIAVIMYEMIIVAVLYASDKKTVHQNAKLMTTATASVITLIVITVLNKIYEHLAKFLTNWERPRTNTEYNNSITFKMFCFQFIDFYTPIFYVAFFKGRLGGWPGHYDYMLGYRMEECEPSGCLTELCIQIAIIMGGDQLKNNFMELLGPKMNVLYKRWKAKKNKGNRNGIESGSAKVSRLLKRCEDDFSLEEQPPLGMFEEYLEMLVQYGFVTIFVAAFPLAPLLALLNNIIEIRLDAYKCIALWRRPVAFRADGIGVWFDILQSVSVFSVLSNAFIIAWTSDFVPKLVYKLIVSPDMSLTGYVNHSLSVFDVRDFENYTTTNVDFKDVKFCR
ncbi:hypothetical protein NP493_989g01025 [Ridgeia piscesae]|uniref:Anoctamin n=1 Tax=Ridgeia piscesae TaxID=27915 RepID=A0AAD9NKQ7_RIDPI|nr:hypothetical protein NP493_989g01025 [Ridgeia piscesae]